MLLNRAKALQQVAQRRRERLPLYRPEAPAGDCTRDTPRCRDARDYHADLRPCCRGHIRQIVADVLPILRAFKLTVWADYGTLLGAVRNPMLGLDPGIIPHDKDADFGMLEVTEPRLRRVADAIRGVCGEDGKPKGYQVLIRPRGSSMKVLLSRLNRSNADFFNWFEQPKTGLLRRLSYIECDRFKGKRFLKATAFPLTSVPWEGLTLPAPKHPESFCEFRYGPQWKTPIRANNDGVPRGTP